MLRRIDRGLYDRPALNRLTQRQTTPDYQATVNAIAQRDHLRILVDGMTVANDLGLNDALPARVTLYADTRRRPIKLDKLLIVSASDKQAPIVIRRWWCMKTNSAATDAEGWHFGRPVVAPIKFKQAAPSCLYWAGRPAMRVVQALHWLTQAMQKRWVRVVMKHHTMDLGNMLPYRRRLPERPSPG